MIRTGTVREKRLRILVVEDSELRSQFLSDKFSEHDVQVVKDPLAAVEFLNHAKYDVIFLDYDLTAVPSQALLEKGTGIYVAKRLSETINKSTPVVVHSMNIRGAEYMVGILENAVMVPFNWLREDLEKNEVSAFFQRVLRKK